MLKSKKRALNRIVGSSKPIPCPVCFGIGTDPVGNANGTPRWCKLCGGNCIDYKKTRKVIKNGRS